MADFSALKTSIQNYIKQNGNEEITGNLLQQVLLSMVTTLGDSAINDLVTALNNEVSARQNADGTLQGNINTLQGNINTLQGVVNGIKANIDNGYVYAGIANPSTTPASGKVFYLALTAGTYTNFGATVVPQGINILKYNGSAWSLDSFLGLDNAPTQGSNNLVKSGGVLDSIIKDGSAFDLSAYNGGTTYADLSAALTALNALPAAYKKGGMSMKFVQSSDNKYVQYRLMAQNFTADVTNWESYNNDAQTGYYVCDTASDVATKAVTAPDYILKNGGSIKIKMVHKNTVNSATLNIQNTGAIPLYYNGKRTGEDNTWKDDEVIEVYYDPSTTTHVTGQYNSKPYYAPFGNIYDVSVENLVNGNPSTYATLNAAASAIPITDRQSGMTIRYIDSVSGEYIQKRYLQQYVNTGQGNNNFVSERFWQGVDEDINPMSQDVAKISNVVKIAGLIENKVNSTIFELKERAISTGYYTLIEKKDVVVGEHYNLKINYTAASGFACYLEVLYGSTSVKVGRTNSAQSDSGKELTVAITDAFTAIKFYANGKVPACSAKITKFEGSLCDLVNNGALLNIANPEYIHSGKQINSNNGAMGSNANFTCVYLLPITQGKYFVNGFGNRTDMYLYNYKGDWLGSTAGKLTIGGTQIIEVPSDCYFISANLSNAGSAYSADKYQINKSNIPVPFTPFTPIQINDNSLPETARGLAEWVSSRNLIDKDEIVLNSKVGTDGSFSAEQGYGRTGYVKVLPETTYIVSGHNTSFTLSGCAYSWDFTNKTFIEQLSFTGNKFTTPANCVFVVINYTDENPSQYDNTLQMNEGETVKPYEPYFETKRQIKKEFLPTSGGEAYDQSLNTYDSVEFRSLKVNSMLLDLPTSSTGLSSGSAWIDTANGNVIKVVQ